MTDDVPVPSPDAPEVVRALCASLATDDPGHLVGHLADDAVGESTVAGLPTVVHGPEAIAACWSRLTGGSGPLRSVAVTTEAGGHDVDVVLKDPAQGRDGVRRLHRLHLRDGLVSRHVVHPATLPPSDVDPVPPGIRAESVRPVDLGGFSGSGLFRALTDDDEDVLLKLVRPEGWMARATRDPGREALLVGDGVLASLPTGLSCPVRSAHDGPRGWTLVMTDHAEATAVTSLPVLEAAPRLLGALHDLHTAYAGSPAHPALCSLPHRLGLFGPRTLLREIAGQDFLPKTLPLLWEAFYRQGPRDVVDPVFEVLGDPSGLLSALEGLPRTLLHGDYQPTNLLLDGDEVVALDWGLAASGPAELDFVWFLANAAWEGDEERASLEGLWTEITGVPRDDPAVDLSIVFHAAMGELGFLISEAESALAGAFAPSSETVAWWLDRTRTALDRVGGDILGR